MPFDSRKQQEWYYATGQTFLDDEPHSARQVKGGQDGKEVDLLTKGKIPEGSPATSADDNQVLEADISSVSGPPADSNMRVIGKKVHVQPKGEGSEAEHIHNLKSYWGGWYCDTPDCPTKKYQKKEGDMEIVTEKNPLMLNENYIQDQFGVLYRPVYAGESIDVTGDDILIYENKYYTTEGVGNCGFCKGAGKVTVERLGLKDCPDCDGTGSVGAGQAQQPMGGQPQIPDLMSQVPQQQQEIQQQSQQMQGQNQMKQPQTELPTPDLQQIQDQKKQEMQQNDEGKEKPKIGESEKKTSNESCGCPKKKAREANIVKYKEYITGQINILKKKARAGEAVSVMYGLPSIQKNGRKIKGTLAYAGVSLNDRIYLPEELAKGHGMTLPLLLNHSLTAGAEQELWRLEDDMLQALYNEEDYQVGEVTLTWDPNKLTLFYEGVITHPFFQKEVDEANMAVSLGIYYDSNSPRVCDENCYTLIKRAEFREVSLVYHAGFPIATIEAVEAELKNRAFNTIMKESMEEVDSLINNKMREKVGEELDKIMPTEQPIDVKEKPNDVPIPTELISLKDNPTEAPPKEDTVDQVPMIGEALTAPSNFSVRGVVGMTISNINGVQKYTLEPFNGYESNTIHFEVKPEGAMIFGENLQLQPEMTTPKKLTKEIEKKPDLKVEDGGQDVLSNLKKN